MNELIQRIPAVAAIIALLAVQACASPLIDAIQPDPVAVEDSSSGTEVDGSSASVPIANNESGLGTIKDSSNARTGGCKKQRRTGSHMYRVDCADPDSGSQPVRSGDYWDLRHLTMSGSVRPE